MAFLFLAQELPLDFSGQQRTGEEVRKMKTIRALLVAGLLAGVLGLPLHAEPVRITGNLRGEKVLLPPSAPVTDRFMLVSFVTIGPEAERMTILAVYDDPQTRRPIDYLELYDGAGGLLLVSWVDRFGIRRTAMDRGILQEEVSNLEGVLILVIEGIPV